MRLDQFSQSSQRAAISRLTRDVGRDRIGFLSATLGRDLCKFAWAGLCVLWMLASSNGYALGAGMTKPPVAVPFDITMEGESIDIKIRIVEKQIYTFSLGFILDQNDRVNSRRLQRLMGTGRIGKSGELADDGEPLKVELSIQEQTDNMDGFSYVAEISSFPWYSTRAEGFHRKIVDLQLNPGRYAVRLKNILGSTAFQVPVVFEIRRGYFGK